MSLKWREITSVFVEWRGKEIWVEFTIGICCVDGKYKEIFRH